MIELIDKRSASHSEESSGTFGLVVDFFSAKYVNKSQQQIQVSSRLRHLHSAMAPFDLDACIQQLLRKQLLHEALLREICEKTKEVLMRESNVVHVSAPVTVVGDIHG